VIEFGPMHMARNPGFVHNNSAQSEPSHNMDVVRLIALHVVLILFQSQLQEHTHRRRPIGSHVMIDRNACMACAV
jgi:hypothetical protein